MQIVNGTTHLAVSLNKTHSQSVCNLKLKRATKFDVLFLSLRQITVGATTERFNASPIQIRIFRFVTRNRRHQIACSSHILKP